MGLRNNRRLGKFYIGWDVINEYPELAKAMLKDVIVLRTSEMYDMDAIEYIGLSEQFEEVWLGNLTPFYEPVFTNPSQLTEIPIQQFERWQKVGVLPG